mgnify:CR=1 FL=1
MHLMRLAGTIGWLPVGGWALRAIIAALMEWQRKSELSGDRAGLLCGQDVHTAIRVQMKLAGGSRVSEIDVDAFLAQAAEYDAARQPPAEATGSAASESTHAAAGATVRARSRIGSEGSATAAISATSAVITALIGSGFPCHAFRFGGFLSVKSGKRRSALAAALDSGETGIFFESPHRIVSTLEILAEVDPAARTCVARELTKKFETYHRGTAAEVLAHFKAHPPKGEIVLLVHSEM